MKLADVSDIVDAEATLGQRWLRVAICGPSGGGKTFSALRLGTGMVSITGGPLRLIDTQNGQSADNAERFKFRILNFPPPFTPQRFLAAMHRCIKDGSRVIIVDSASDEHEGFGGVCDMQEEAEERMFNNACEKAERNGWKLPDRDKFNQLAWRDAKAARRELILGLPFVEAHVIFLFKAKKQSAAFAERPRKGADNARPQKDDADGWKPIAGDKLFWDMPLRMLLLPMANGVPTWSPVAESERTYIRRPTQFDALISRFEGKSLCEEMGAEMAQWAKGDATQPNAESLPTTATKKPGEVLRDDIAAQISAASSHVQLDALAAGVAASVESKKFGEQTAKWLHARIETKRVTLAEGA